MKYTSITVTTDHQNAELVSSAFFDVGTNGVSVLDRQDFLDLIKSDVIWDYIDEDAVAKSDEVKISTTVAFDNKNFAVNLEKRLNEMKNLGGVKFGEIVLSELNAEDWENEWKKYYHPIVTKNITVVPTWIDYPRSENEKIMRLDPGMAFGTGEHATTRMCLDLMNVNGKSVIDVGCGSGILGIAAKLCGAKSVYMCDVDLQAVEFSRLNAKLNGVDAIIEHTDLIQGNVKADFIFANITADILMRLSKSIGAHLNDGGEIVLSGIIDTRLDEVKDCYKGAGYEIIEERKAEDWRALKLKKAVR